jgi:hypothetical protein
MNISDLVAGFCLSFVIILGFITLVFGVRITITHKD